MNRSPYLENAQRLQDVMAAIQFMGAHDFEKLNLVTWTKKLGQPKSAKTWATVFDDHPEFFHVEENEEKNNELYYSLQWRRAYDRNYDSGKNKEVDAVQRETLSPSEKMNLSRKPLNSEQIGTLLQAAINLDTRLHAFDERRRWLISALLPLVGGIIGALIGALLKAS